MKIKNRAVLKLIMAGLIALLAISGTSVFAKNLELSDYMYWETAGSPQISPDGSSIIYTRTHADIMTDDWVSELWMMNADGKRNRFLTKGGGVNWAPDGERIAYVGGVGDKAQIFVRWMDAEGATSQITHEINDIGSLVWSSDGKKIAFQAGVPINSTWEIDLPPRPEGAEWTEDSRVVERLSFRADGEGYTDYYNHLFVVTAEGGTARQITKGNWNAGGLEWTPDGSGLVFSGVVNKDQDSTSHLSNINFVDIASGETRVLNVTPGSWGGPLVSPDGRTVAFTGTTKLHTSEPTYPPVQLRLVDIDGKNERTLIADIGDDLMDIRWSRDGKGFYLNLGSRGTTNVKYVDLKGKVRTITSGNHAFNVSSVSDKGVMAGIYSTPHITSNVATAKLRDGKIKQLTDLNGDILEGVELGAVEEINYKSFDGTPIQGWIVFPPDFDPSKKYPLELAIHGGPHGMYGVEFSYIFQEMAANGYVVLYTNPRGSTGYGTAFANAIDDSYPGEYDMGDLMAGVDAMISRNYIDEKRLFVSGCSGGGILTTYIVTQTDRFNAAVALCPIVNWFSAFGGTDSPLAVFDIFSKPFWEDMSSWIDHGPLFHAHKVKTPTMLMVGANDIRTPVQQSEEFYTALKINGVPTKLIYVADEWHGTDSKPSNMMRTLLYVRKWYEEHSGSK